VLPQIYADALAVAGAPERNQLVWQVPKTRPATDTHLHFERDLASIAAVEFRRGHRTQRNVVVLTTAEVQPDRVAVEQRPSSRVRVILSAAKDPRLQA
jgi:hypothetical protein